MIAGRRWIARALIGALAITACTSSSQSDVRAASVYAAIVRWFADRRSDDPEPLPVFIEARGEGARIDLAVQAELIDVTSEFATSRFIDSRDEAIVDAEEDEGEATTVRDDGVLIRLDPVVEQGRPVTVDVDEYVADETLRTLRFQLTATDETWRVIGDPAEVPSG